MSFWEFDPNTMTKKYMAIGQKHYPMRRVPKEWPDMKLIGKAIVRGWAIPCRYYRFGRSRGRGYYQSFVFAGISDEEYMMIRRIMNREEKNC